MRVLCNSVNLFPFSWWGGFAKLPQKFWAALGRRGSWKTAEKRSLAALVVGAGLSRDPPVEVEGWSPPPP